MKSLKYYLKIAISSVFTVILLTNVGIAQDRKNEKTRPSPNASVSQTMGTTQISITYGRPSVNGREVFGGLEAYGEVWRTGANESTAITFSDDVKIEGKTVEAGTYSLYTIPRKDTWTIIINEKLAWGTSYNKSKDVIRVEVSSKEASHMEQFLISFHDVTDSSVECVLHWKNTKVPFTIEV